MKNTGNEKPFTTDMNWGCTLRVGQMLVCNTLLRHLFLDKEEKAPSQFDYLDFHRNLSLHNINRYAAKKEIYLNILSQIFDNHLPEELIGDDIVKPVQAFNLHNIGKMALATQNFLPGNWMGVGQISHLLKRLNRLFRPLCDDF